VRAAVLVLPLALALAGCGGGGGEERQARERPASPPCSPGERALRLDNGQAARMRVTPAAAGGRALFVVLHGAGQTPADALQAFRGGWETPGLVLIAPKSKGQTWSILRSEVDDDLESVNFALAEAYERCQIDRSRIAVGGFSDGATYALTLGVSNGDLFPAIMALSPGGIVAGEQVGAPRVFISHGTLDTVLPIERAGDAVVAKLRAAGYAVTYRRFRGGHEASLATSSAAVRWFLAG
jgi:phospholipase/carboxylesterase